MKLNNLSTKKLCRLVSAGLILSMMAITVILSSVMQDIRIFITGATLTLCAFFGYVCWYCPLEIDFLFLLLICAERWTT